MKVYSVGVIQADLSDNAGKFIKEQRLWYLFKNFEDAEKCVLENHGDIFECDYDYAVIEETYVHDYSNPAKDGELAYVPEQWWYHAEYSTTNRWETDPIICKVNRPKCMENVCYIWIG